MRHLILTFLATAALAVAPAAASAQTGQQIPVPGPILTRIGHTPMVELSDGGGGLPYLGASQSYNAGNWEDALREYHKSVYGSRSPRSTPWPRSGSSARRATGGSASRAAASRSCGGAHHGRRHGNAPAIVFDVDETALSNYTAIDADNFTYGTQSRAEAVNEIGTAIAPSLELYKLAQKKGIATFFITGRGEDVRDHTASNLQREGFTNYTRLVLKPTGFAGSTVDYKAGARKAIEGEGYRIVASVGDQYSDLAGGHEDVAFKLPNPFYFLP